MKTYRAEDDGQTLVITEAEENYHDAPAGYKFTGEYRRAYFGEYYFSGDEAFRWTDTRWTEWEYPILKRIAQPWWMFDPGTIIKEDGDDSTLYLVIRRRWYEPDDPELLIIRDRTGEQPPIITYGPGATSPPSSFVYHGNIQDVSFGETE